MAIKRRFGGAQAGKRIMSAMGDMTFTNLEEKTGISRSALNRIALGHLSSRRNFERLASFFKIEVSALLAESTPDTRKIGGRPAKKRRSRNAGSDVLEPALLPDDFGRLVKCIWRLAVNAMGEENASLRLMRILEVEFDVRFPSAIESAWSNVRDIERDVASLIETRGVATYFHDLTEKFTP
jgi:transcriptional regulator with XRE-family HTH domain